MSKKHLFISILLLFPFFIKDSCAQKIGVVLSGGGATGLSHVGVLEVLEDNHIPIDYIAGTSMGALIGGLYASGYSPRQIDSIVRSEQFKNWAEGEIEEKYVYYFKKKETDASWVGFKFSFDNVLKTSLPTNLISPVPIDFALVEIFAKPAAASHYNFDSLFVPFRCVASDITSKKLVLFKEGDLGRSIRASMSYPFYLKPVSIDNKLFFDGGLYDNFPVDAMYNEFKPDIVIGSNVSDPMLPPDEDNVISQIKSMIINRPNPNDCACIVIKPKIDGISLFGFGSVAEAIESGAKAAKEKIDSIKTIIPRRQDSLLLKQKREAFINKQTPLIFDNIFINGLKKSQANYVKKLLSHKSHLVSIKDIKPKYYRLVSDEKIKQIYPQAKFNEKTGYYNLLLKIKKEKDVFIAFGGNISSRPINTGFISAQYNYLGKIATSVMANYYFGKLYGSYQVKLHFDFPSQVPYSLETSFTRNRFDFFKSNVTFFEEVKPSYLVQNENYGDVNIALPAKNKGKFKMGFSLADLYNDYYQTQEFTNVDTTDRTSFLAYTPYLLYEQNTLNRKQFASSGIFFNIKASYVEGNEVNKPGSTSLEKKYHSEWHNWFQIKFQYDNYFKRKGIFKYGFYAEGVYSTQDFFNNYTASILASPAFTPIPESKTFFLDNFRTHSYAAIGLKQVTTIFKNLDVRLEGFIFQPYKEILKQADLSAVYGNPFSNRYYIGSSSIVYHSPIGPVSFSVNYYDKKDNPFSFLFSIGYIIFNKKSTE